MKRLIFVPQYPAKMRYQEWWFTELPKQFSKYFDEVIVLGKEYFKNEEARRGEAKNFSPVNANIRFECAQISEYLSLPLLKNDRLLLADISFPGIFSGVLYHKPCYRMFVFCHATSANSFDYYERVRRSKFPVETSHAMLFHKVFIGSYYSANKVGWRNTQVVTLPPPPLNIISPFPYVDRIHNIVSVCRPSIQKTTKHIERKVENVFGPIERQFFDNWNCYSKFLSASKILLITSKEDTFNYTIMDALRCGCIPIAPNKLCFPEILPKEYLYDDIRDLIEKLKFNLSNEATLPRMLCENKVVRFYENICESMLED